MDLLRVDLTKSAERALENPLRRAKFNASPTFSVKAGSRSTYRHIVVFGHSRKAPVGKALRLYRLPDWQLAQVAAKSQLTLDSELGPVHVLQAAHYDAPETRGHGKRLQPSKYGRLRDLVGAFWRTQRFSADASVHVMLSDMSSEETLGALVGLGLAGYDFRSTLRGSKNDIGIGPQMTISTARGKIERPLIELALAIVTSMNFARHLANLPAASANPDALARFFAEHFAGRPNLQVEVWDVAQLRKEKMGLLLGVGHGSEFGARFVHLRYRPKRKIGKSGKKNTAPLAFVGKGVTFDTGGLDIKPASGMRLMKKDMSGVAIVAALCEFTTTLRLGVPCDFYLPLAENAVSDRATRPGDVHQSRAGHFVEIDNTDAEGRLVMADAIDVAVSQEGVNAPEAVIDVSTLTGAMRVAVGLDVAGFFSNRDRLAREAEQAAQKMGEMAWRMPLVQKYARSLNSSFADFKNSSESGFGGAITAALFLEKFVRRTPWLHFDVMAWNNSADGAIAEGSNAQCLQILIGMMLGRARAKI